MDDCIFCGEKRGTKILHDGIWYCEDCLMSCTVCGENKELISKDFAIDYIGNEDELPMCEDCFYAKYGKQVESDYKNCER